MGTRIVRVILALAGLRRSSARASSCHAGFLSKPYQDAAHSVKGGTSEKHWRSGCYADLPHDRSLSGRGIRDIITLSVLLSAFGTEWGPAMKSTAIPAPAVRRLSLYLRELESLWRNDQRTVSSKQLGEALKLTPTQIRKDLAYFGQFGQPGIGYDVNELTTRIRRILGTDRTWNVLLVGAGNLGMALSAYRGFARKGFRLVAVFDDDPSKVGRPLPGVPGLLIQPVGDIPAVVREKDIRLAIVAVPAESAQGVADVLVAAGVRGLLNFAPVNINVSGKVAVSAVDLAVQLEQLSFQVGAAV